jgi:hypothetical protein
VRKLGDSSIITPNCLIVLVGCELNDLALLLIINVGNVSKGVILFYYFPVGIEQALICWRQRIILRWLLDLNILLSVFLGQGLCLPVSSPFGTY